MRLGRVGVLLLAVPLLMGSGLAAAVADQQSTVVSLTFDDGVADQMAAVDAMAQYRVSGTFYLISGAVGTPGYVTRAQLRHIADEGDEIGGHTVSHLDLTTVPTAEARRQVCMSRSRLTAWGYRVTSFAYPDGSANPTVEGIVRDCGYDSGRAAAGLRTAGCPGCVAAENQKPADPYAIRTPSQVDTRWTLQALEQTVLAAQQNGGGWVPLVFHHVCASDCGDLAVSTDTFRAFVAWLVAGGIAVRTVDQVMGGPVRPLVTWSPSPAHGVVNGSLAALGTSGAVDPAREQAVPAADDIPQCWMKGGYGNNAAGWRRVPGVRDGQWAERLTITSYTSGDAKLLPQFDLGNCSIPVRDGTAYQLSTWYRSTTNTQFAVYYRDPDGRWIYWTSSPYFPAAARWTDAVWRTPALPAGASGLSFGLALFSVGSLTTGDYGIRDVVPAAAAPPMLSLLTVPLLGAAAVLLGCYAQAVIRRRRGHIARRVSGMSSNNR